MARSGLGSRLVDLARGAAPAPRREGPPPGGSHAHGATSRPGRLRPPRGKLLTASSHASSCSSSSRVTCFSARPSMAAGNSSRYLGKGSDGESEPRGSARPPDVPTAVPSLQGFQPLARARSTSRWHPRTAAQLLGSSQPQSSRAAAIPTRRGGASGAGRRSARAGSCPDDLGASQASDAARRVAASACSPACPAPASAPASASRLVHARPRPPAGRPSRWPRPPARPEVPVAERWTGPERIAGSGCGRRAGPARSLGAEPRPCRAAP